MNTLSSGNTMAVIAPSGSLKTVIGVSEEAKSRISSELGLNIVYGQHSLECDLLQSSSIASRISDLHAAFEDSSIKAIMCATGGYNSNELLPYIDWKIMAKNPKPLIGSSDNTVLLNAIYAKTGLVTYFSPNFYKFGMRQGLEYSLEYFKKVLMQKSPVQVLPSDRWSNDRWYKDQEKRIFFDSNGHIVLNPGSAKGVIVGGNLCSLNLLQGTEFMPDLSDKVLFIEDDDLAGDSSFGEFARNLESLLQVPSARSLKAIVVGRFPVKSNMTEEKLRFIFRKPAFKKIPVIANLDFGHTDPCITFPIGGTAEISADSSGVKLVITQ